MKYFSFLKCLSLLYLIVVISMITGCGSSKAKPQKAQSGQMDTLDYHVSRGDESINNNEYQKAKKSYDRAIDLASDNSSAYSGKALATAHLGMRSGSSKEQKQQSLDSAIALIEKSLDNAKTDAEKARANAYAIRIYVVTKLPEAEWFEKVQEYFNNAVELSPNNPEVYLYMARAEAEKHNYTNASKWYNKVLEINTTLLKEANEELERVQMVQRAQPGSRFGKAIAFVPKISKADISALFIAELKLSRIYKDRAAKKTPGYTPPKSQQGFTTESLLKAPVAKDIMGHPMEDTIKEILQLQVKGLEADAAHKFHPDKEITRAEYALMIQDILVKISQDSGLATQFIGSESPFPDVRQDVYYYNAARVAVGRNLMKVKNKVSGDFDPAGTVSGAEALLSVRDFNEILRSYLK